MAITLLTEELRFPQPRLTDCRTGPIAVGGDLSAERLLLAYSMGIFPWYSEGSPILWWSPDPRLVLLPSELSVSRSLRQTMRKGTYTVTFDAAFDRVIRACALTHATKDGETWITPEMLRAYCRLHELGHAHSVESWRDGQLAGGLYGISIGGAFFGESMFALAPDASKAAFVTLVGRLAQWGYGLIDCQVHTDHLARFGARELPIREFLDRLDAALLLGPRWAYAPS